MSEPGRDKPGEGFEPYPYEQALPKEQTPREPTNAELDAATRPTALPWVPPAPRTNWVALARVIAFLLVIVAVAFSIFPPGTWEFGFGP